MLLVLWQTRIAFGKGLLYRNTLRGAVAPRARMALADRPDQIRGQHPTHQIFTGTEYVWLVPGGP